MIHAENFARFPVDFKDPLNIIALIYGSRYLNGVPLRVFLVFLGFLGRVAGPISLNFIHIEVF